MSKLLNGLLAVWTLMILGMGIQAYFFPAQGANPSVVSLAVGTVLAMLMLGSLALHPSHPRISRIISLALCVIVTGRFLPVFISKGTIYPAGIASLFSLVLVALLGFGHMLAQREKKKAEANG